MAEQTASAVVTPDPVSAYKRIFQDVLDSRPQARASGWRML